MQIDRSPLARPFPQLPDIAGVTLRVARARYKTWDRCDLTFAELAEGTAAAGVFTKSACASSEVELGREAVKLGRARALVVNAGNSNAFTGWRGRAAVEAIRAQVSGALGCSLDEVFVSSTGVIGVPLPIDRAEAGITAALEAAPCGWEDAANAIGTTDTFAKGAGASAMIGGTRIEMAGIIKGSGMIAPDMATMLSFIATDAKIPAAALQAMLKRGCDTTFNCVTVDSDTSTSDTVLLFATGQAKHPRVPTEGGPMLRDFRRALEEVLHDLALMVARDGEGAQKLITVKVTGAASARSAKHIAMSIANSPLVKTAVAGEDANWGRVVMAVGKAGEPADRDLLSVAMGGVLIAQNGAAVEGYDEAPVTAHMKGREVEIAVDIGLGRGKATVWTCDLTHGYVDINGSYRS